MSDESRKDGSRRGGSRDVEKRHRLACRSETREGYCNCDVIQDRRREVQGDAPPRRTEQAQPCKVLAIFGLSNNTTERDLYDVFSSYGSLENIRIVYHNFSGRSRGFAFVYYDAIEDAQRAKTSCEGGLAIDGRVAHVDYSFTTAPHRPTPGVYLGKKNDNRRRRDNPSDRPPENDMKPSYGNDMSSPGRPMRPHHSWGSVGRRRTVSSSRSLSSPPVFNLGRQGPEDALSRPRESGRGTSVGGVANAAKK